VARQSPQRHATKNGTTTHLHSNPVDDYEAKTDDAKRWQGWGTALKPAWEPIVLARKPLDGTVAQNHLRHGCGGVNVDGCRVGTDVVEINVRNGWQGFGNTDHKDGYEPKHVQGRWPANLILDAEAGAVLDGQAGECPSAKNTIRNATRIGGYNGTPSRPPGTVVGYGDTGGPSRFFYCPKASKSDRDADNNHPTVKPTDLMRWLARLVTPQGGTILDPFTGSGSTGKAARLDGFGFVGIEREPEYADIARARIEAVEPMLIGGVG
jgi:hypothetical protein